MMLDGAGWPGLGRMWYFAAFPELSQGRFMSLSSDDVQKIAHLACLAVSDEEAEALRRDLSNILDLVEQMAAVDTSAIEPMAHPLAMNQRLRPDEVTESDRRDLYLRNAPAAEKGLFLVPRVIE